MINVTDAVREILFEDDIGLQAAQTHLLNFSAYAEKILPLVEARTRKEVKKGTVVVALTRISQETTNLTLLRPQVVLDDLIIKSPLTDITFSKTALAREQLATLQQNIGISENAFFTCTQSMSEITIIAPQSLLNDILKHFDQEPLAVYRDRAGLTVRFSKDYLNVPNVLYTVQAALAVHLINFTEVVSTHTEFSIVINKDDVEIASRVLQRFMT